MDGESTVSEEDRRGSGGGFGGNGLVFGPGQLILVGAQNGRLQVFPGLGSDRVSDLTVFGLSDFSGGHADKDPAFGFHDFKIVDGQFTVENHRSKSLHFALLFLHKVNPYFGNIQGKRPLTGPTGSLRTAPESEF